MPTKKPKAKPTKQHNVGASKSVRLYDKQYARVKVAAAKAGVSMLDWVNEAIQRKFRDK